MEEAPAQVVLSVAATGSCMTCLVCDERQHLEPGDDLGPHFQQLQQIGPLNQLLNCWRHPNSSNNGVPVSQFEGDESIEWYCPPCLADLQQIYKILDQLDGIKAKVIGKIHISYTRNSLINSLAKHPEQRRQNLRAQILHKSRLIEANKDECPSKEQPESGFTNNFTATGPLHSRIRIHPAVRHLLAPIPEELVACGLNYDYDEFKADIELTPPEWEMDLERDPLALDDHLEHNENQAWNIPATPWLNDQDPRWRPETRRVTPAAAPGGRPGKPSAMKPKPRQKKRSKQTIDPNVRRTGLLKYKEQKAVEAPAGAGNFPLQSWNPDSQAKRGKGKEASSISHRINSTTTSSSTRRGRGGLIAAAATIALTPSGKQIKKAAKHKPKKRSGRKAMRETMLRARAIWTQKREQRKAAAAASAAESGTLDHPVQEREMSTGAPATTSCQTSPAPASSSSTCGFGGVKIVRIIQNPAPPRSRKQPLQARTYELLEQPPEPLDDETKMFLCQKCSREFPTEKECNQHSVKCTRNWRCPVCDKSTGDAHGYATHVQTAHRGLQLGPGTCTLCSKSCQKLEDHYVHIHQTDFKCGVCGAKFTRWLNYNYHRTTHPELQLPPVKCDQGSCAGTIFTNHRSLLTHIARVHQGFGFGYTRSSYVVKKCMCPMCGQDTGTPLNLRTHMKEKHPNVQFGRGNCRLCGKRIANLQRHYAKTHKTELTCNICQAKFTIPLEFIHHMTTHPELKLPPVKCEQCGLICKDNVSLLVHMRQHQKKVHCEREGCEFGCATKLQLDFHLKTVHEGLQESQCRICHRVFSDRRYLRVHMQLHEGTEDRRHVCEVCGRRFKDTLKLKDHREAIHGDGSLPFICEHCGKGFPIFNYLYIHLRSHESAEQKRERREKALKAREERLQAGVPILAPRGRPRVRPIGSKKGKRGDAANTEASAANSTESAAVTDSNSSEDHSTTTMMTTNSTNVPPSQIC